MMIWPDIFAKYLEILRDIEFHVKKNLFHLYSIVKKNQQSCWLVLIAMPKDTNLPKICNFHIAKYIPDWAIFNTTIKFPYLIDTKY